MIFLISVTLFRTHRPTCMWSRMSGRVRHIIKFQHRLEEHLHWDQIWDRLVVTIWTTCRSGLSHRHLLNKLYRVESHSKCQHDRSRITIIHAVRNYDIIVSVTNHVRDSRGESELWTIINIFVFSNFCLSRIERVLSPRQPVLFTVQITLFHVSQTEKGRNLNNLKWFLGEKNIKAVQIRERAHNKVWNAKLHLPPIW